MYIVKKIIAQYLFYVFSNNVAFLYYSNISYIVPFRNRQIYIIAAMNILHS